MESDLTYSCMQTLLNLPPGHKVLEEGVSINSKRNKRELKELRQRFGRSLFREEFFFDMRMTLGARFSKAPEPFRTCKAIFSSSASKNGI